MPRNVSIPIYLIHELEPEARKQARRTHFCEMHIDDQPIIEDFKKICEIIGINISETPYGEDIFYDYRSRENSASFAGTLKPVRGAREAICEHAPDDIALKNIVFTIDGVQIANDYELHADIALKRSHSQRRSKINAHVRRISEQGETREPADPYHEEQITNALHDLATWLHRTLHKNYARKTTDLEIERDCNRAGKCYFADGSEAQKYLNLDKENQPCPES